MQRLRHTAEYLFVLQQLGSFEDLFSYKSTFTNFIGSLICGNKSSLTLSEIVVSYLIWRETYGTRVALFLITLSEIVVSCLIWCGTQGTCSPYFLGKIIENWCCTGENAHQHYTKQMPSKILAILADKHMPWKVKLTWISSCRVSLPRALDE